MKPGSVKGLPFGEPCDESSGRVRGSYVNADGSTCVRFVVASSVFSGRFTSVHVLKRSVPFDFGEPLGGDCPSLDPLPGRT